MRIIAVRSLREFWAVHADAEAPLRAWYTDTKKARWKAPEDIRATYATVSIVGSNRAVFNIRGNKYRLIVAINYGFGIIYVRFVGTHSEYDRVDAETV